MTIPLREYLAQRRADIQATIKALRKEMAEIDAAESALSAVAEASPKPRRQRGSAASGKPTLKELALEALADSPGGMEATAILSWIAEKHGLEVARESMSPQLTRLARDGEIVRLNGGLWQLQWVNEMIGEAPVKNEAPDGYQPSDASEEEDEEIPF